MERDIVLQLKNTLVKQVSCDWIKFQFFQKIIFFNNGVKLIIDIVNASIDKLADNKEIRKINGCSSPVIINNIKRITLGIPRINNIQILTNIR